MRFDLDALLDPIELIKVPMFLFLFLVVRGLPALLYRRDLMPRDVAALGLLQSAGLPLIVVITGLGVASGQMRSDNAAGLVGAGLLSVVILPIIALSAPSRPRHGCDGRSNVRLRRVAAASVAPSLRSKASSRERLWSTPIPLIAVTTSWPSWTHVVA